MNKRAIVTGGSDGIGRAIVLELGKAGYDVLTNGRNPEKIQSVITEFEKFKGKLYTHAGDLAAPNGIDRFIAFCSKTFPTVDLIVNNAGMQIGDNLIENAEQSDIELMMKVHVFTPLALYKN